MTTTNIHNSYAYLLKVKNSFSTQPHIYSQFLDIINKSKDNQSLSETYNQIKELFKTRTDLIAEFSNFLPPSHHQNNELATATAMPIKSKPPKYIKSIPKPATIRKKQYSTRRKQPKWEYRAVQNAIKMESKALSNSISITTSAKEILVSMIRDLTKRLAYQAKEFQMTTSRKLLNYKDVESAVKLLFSGQLRSVAIDKGLKSIESKSKLVNEFNNLSVSSSSPTYNNKASEQQPQAVNLQTPSATLRLALREKPTIKASSIQATVKKMIGKVQKSSMVFLACVVDFVLNEMIELTSKNANSMQRNRIDTNDIKWAIKTDNELALLFKGITIKMS